MEELQQSMAVSILARVLLAAPLARHFRKRYTARILQVLESPGDWHMAREQTLEVETALQSMHSPLCVLLGQDAHTLRYDQYCQRKKIKM